MQRIAVNSHLGLSCPRQLPAVSCRDAITASKRYYICPGHDCLVEIALLDVAKMLILCRLVCLVNYLYASARSLILHKNIMQLLCMQSETSQDSTTIV